MAYQIDLCVLVEARTDKENNIGMSQKTIVKFRVDAEQIIIVLRKNCWEIQPLFKSMTSFHR